MNSCDKHTRIVQVSLFIFGVLASSTNSALTSGSAGETLVRTPAHTHIGIHVNTREYLHTSAHTPVHVHTPVYTHTCKHLHAQTYTQAYTCTQAHLHTRTCMHMHLHTHSQIHESRSQMYKEQPCRTPSHHIRRTLWNNSAPSWKTDEGETPQQGGRSPEGESHTFVRTRDAPLRSFPRPFPKQRSIPALLENNCLVWSEPDCMCAVYVRWWAGREKTQRSRRRRGLSPDWVEIRLV